MLIERDSNRWKRLTVSGVLFIVIAAMVYKNSMLIGTLDSVLQALVGSAHGTGGAKSLMTLVSFLGSPKMDIVWTLIIAFFMWGFRFKIPALWGICTLIGGDVLGFIVKHIVKRVRPAQHMASDDGYSFPSGHVLGFFIVAAIIFLVVLPVIQSAAIRVICQILLIIFVALLAISRVYLSAHFPFDTIGAMLLAYSWVQITEYLYVVVAPRIADWRPVHNSYY